MAEPDQQHPASPARPLLLRAAKVPPADIIELVLADHRRIVRLRDALGAAGRGSGSGTGWMLAHAGQRLAEVLAAHLQAEQEICYLSMFGAGRHREWREAMADDDDVHYAICEAGLQRPGTAGWRRAVRAAAAAGTRHVERAQAGPLARWQSRLTASQRRELGRQWSAFIAARARDGHHDPGAGRRV